MLKRLDATTSTKKAFSVVRRLDNILPDEIIAKMICGTYSVPCEGGFWLSFISGPTTRKFVITQHSHEEKITVYAGPNDSFGLGYLPGPTAMKQSFKLVNDAADWIKAALEDVE